MAVRLYMDVHVPRAITDQLRRRGVDVLTAIEDGAGELNDAEVLARARSLGRVTFTQDVRFKALAHRYQREGVPFSGLLFGPQLGGTIGQYVRDLHLIAEASDLEEWSNAVEQLPF